MTAYLAPQFDTQFFDGSTVAAGYKLYTYDSGTTTPKAVYSDQAGTVPHTNPIVLDANGRVAGQMWLGSGEYTFTLKTSADVMVKTWNDVAGSSTIIDSAAYDAAIRADLASTSDASKGAGMVGFIQSGAGAVATTVQNKLREVVSVTDFGAVGDFNENTGVGTDNTTFIQAAINAVAAKASKGAVFIPSGAYKITAALTVPYGVSIYGEGGTASVIHCVACNAFNFTSYGYAIGSMFYEDFGVTAYSGTNFVGFQSLNTPTTTTQDGLYFNRLRFYGWNQCILLSSSWNTTISNCVAQNINNFVTLGQNNGETIGTRIINNRMTYAAGGLGAGNRYAIDIKGTTSFNESVHVLQNQIFGFVRNINIEQNLFLNVIGNDLSGSEYVIAFVTANGGYNISDNYIEVTGTGTGIFGAPNSVETPTTKVNIERNYFQGTASAAVGVQLNTVINAYQWNTTIRGNTFDGFTSNDIKIYGPGKTIVDNNRCMSAALTYSLWFGQVLAGPVIASNNYLNKALYLDVPSDQTTGLLLLQDNVESNSFQTLRRSAAPVTGAWRVGDIVYNTAPATAGYIGWVCTVAGTPGTWKPFGLIA